MMCRLVSGHTVQGAPTTPCKFISLRAHRSLEFDSITQLNTTRAGKDAARAFGTGCFAIHQTHDLRELDEQELEVNMALPHICSFLLTTLPPLHPLHPHT